MQPELQAGIFVFCTIPAGQTPPQDLNPIFIFNEIEGRTLVMLREEAIKADVVHQYPSRLITLTVHSSLEAIGFLAIITKRLAEAGISVNAVSAYYHDHLFVPEEKAEEAMTHLRDLTRNNSNSL